MGKAKAADTPVEDQTDAKDDDVVDFAAENAALKSKLEDTVKMLEQVKRAQTGSDAKVKELLQDKKELEQSKMSAEEKVAAEMGELKSLITNLTEERDKEARQRQKLEALDAAGLGAQYVSLIRDDDIEGGVMALQSLLDSERQKASEEIEKKLGHTPQTPGEVTEADLERFKDDLGYRTKIFRESKDRYRSMLKAIKE